MANAINPDEVTKRKARTPRPAQVAPSEEQDNSAEFRRATKVKINFETMGEFDTPSIVWFDDYNAEHVSSLSLCNMDNILETVISILNDVKDADEDFRVEDMLVEEFLETMIAIKSQFDTPIHIHKWMCECQYNDEKGIVKDFSLDLTTLKYISIEEASKKLREYFRPMYEEMSRGEFEEVMTRKYKYEPLENLSEYPVEEEINKIRVTEPITQYINGEGYEFNFMRIGNLLEGNRLGTKKFASKIKSIKNRKYSKEKGSLGDFKEQQEEDLKKIEELKAKEILLYAQALTLVKHKGVTLNDPEQQIALYRKIPRKSIIQYLDFLEEIKFGISDEKEFECSECGSSNKRLLRKEFNPLEFLPIDVGSNDRLRTTSGGNIFM